MEGHWNITEKDPTEISKIFMLTILFDSTRSVGQYIDKTRQDFSHKLPILHAIEKALPIYHWVTN